MTAPTPCAHCGREVEDRAAPSMDGRGRARWVHVSGGYSVCFPQQPSSPHATPAAAAEEPQP